MTRFEKIKQIADAFSAFKNKRDNSDNRQYVVEEKAATDSSKTQVPERVEPAPEDETNKQSYSDIFEEAKQNLAEQPEPAQDPNVVGFADLFIGREKPAEEKEDDTTRGVVSESEPTQEKRDITAATDTQFLPTGEERETDTSELPLPDKKRPVTQEERARIAGMDTQVLEQIEGLEDTEETDIADETSQLDGPTRRITDETTGTDETKEEGVSPQGIVSRLYKRAKDTFFRDKVTEELKKQAAEIGSPEAPGKVPASVDETVAETDSKIPEPAEAPGCTSAEPKAVEKEARAYITIDDHARWLSDLEAADKNYKNAKGLDVDAAKQTRDDLFEKYASASAEPGVKDKRTLVYVLSELADAYQDAGKFAIARVRAGCAEKQAKALLRESPTADNLCLWGMVKHNLGVYKKEMIEKKKGA